MPHYSRVERVVVDVTAEDHDAELAFWLGAVGGESGRSQRHPEYHWSTLPHQEMAMLVQRLGAGDSRVHLDIHTDDLEAEVARLERLGAARVRRHDRWWVLRDPAGLLFCVVEEPPGRLTDANARRWD